MFLEINNNKNELPLIIIHHQLSIVTIVMLNNKNFKFMTGDIYFHDKSLLYKTFGSIIICLCVENFQTFVWKSLHNGCILLVV